MPATRNASTVAWASENGERNAVREIVEESLTAGGQVIAGDKGLDGSHYEDKTYCRHRQS
jgi:hypothetical protein